MNASFPDSASGPPASVQSAVRSRGWPPSTRCDCAIIGGGPIGIETAVALRERGVDALIVEAGPVGHTIAWWAPQTRWFSGNERIAIAGVPLHTVDQQKASREEYLTYLRTVVDQFRVPVRTMTRVDSVTGGAGSFRLHLSRGPGRDGAACGTLLARRIVLAVGGTDHPNRLCVPGEDLPHVDGYLREIHRYFGRQVVIVGGRNSAVEAAIRLHRAGAQVTLIYRGPQLPDDGIKYWLRPEIEGLVRSGAIAGYFGTTVTSIDEQNVHCRSSTNFKVRADDVLTLIGYRQDASLWDQLAIQRTGPGGQPVHDPATMRTNRPGVYVAGTAIGGTQSSRYQVFLENCHDHATRIADDIAAGINEAISADENASIGDARAVAEIAAMPLKRQIELHPES